jgi:hypothetical protein
MLAVFSMLIVFSLMVTPVAASGNGDGEPGGPITFEQTIPVNIVFIGYDVDHDGAEALLAELPETYEPVVRYPQFYGLPGRDMGLKYDFDYNVVHTDKHFENRFFKYLARIGEPGDLTDFQFLYNEQVNNVLDVSDTVLYVDAPSVEKWLRHSTHELGLDINRSYTVFFINWYDREDFQFHVYTKTDEPDPDTDYNFGEIRESRKMIAWGGTYGRIWFYDLSAGPEAWTDNWNVDDLDLDGNGFEDYRMPPIWEYTPGGFRDPSALFSDLGLVTRFVAIDLLFTTSPLYDPLVTAPGLGGDKVMHIEMFEDDPASSGLDWIDTDFVYEKMKAFQPYYGWQVNLEDNDPIDDGAKRALDIFAGNLLEDDCWTAYGDPFAQLFCYFDINLDLYVPAYDPADYVGEVFAFNTTGAGLGDWFGLLGFADDNWVDGTQSYVFAFDAEEYRDLGYGFSTTAVHEFGHHIGMSHPHDGYDSEMGLDFSPGDEFYFAWSGDESNTIMSYIDLNWDFGWFDRDNMYRYEFAGYMNWAEALYHLVQAHPDSWKVHGLISRADYQWMLAQHRFDDWDYAKAVRHAYRAYTLIAQAAERLGIADTTSTALALQAAPIGTAPHEGDPIRYPDN